MARISKRVKKLVKDVFVQYDDSLDHGKLHIADVIKQSYLYGKHYKLTDSQHEVLMISAVLHDYGLVIGDRKDHELKAANLVLKSNILRAYFTFDEIKLISDCCLNHRTSQIKEDKVYHLLVKIIHDADNGVEIENIIMRGISTMVNEKNKDDNTIISELWEYLDLKHGSKGYKKFLLELPPKRAKAWEESKRLIDTRDPKVEVLMWKYINKLKRES